MSILPSPLKSATANAVGMNWTDGARVVIGLLEKVPSPFPEKIVMLLPAMLLPVPSSLPKEHTIASRTPSPVTSASATHDGLLLNDENGEPNSDRLPAPSFLNTDTLPVF